MQSTTSFWPDKSNFANDFVTTIAHGRLKRVREIENTRPGITARVVEFNRKYLDKAYVEHRQPKNAPATVDADAE
jgi:hypothetical protein